MKKLIIISVISIFTFLGIGLIAHSSNPNETVVFNTKTHKVHKTCCSSAQKCTVNCVNTTRAKAYKQGGIACKVCGG